MKTKNLRRIIALIIILISLFFLVWGIMPFDEAIRTLPISPQDMQLPNPESFLPLLEVGFIF